MKADVTTLEAKKAGTVDLPDDVFGLEPRADILQRMVRYQLLKRQAGTHHAKDRSLVSGRHQKMYKQKGTGRARHGNKLAPQFRGGGKAFGPVPRSHAIDLPKKIRALGAEARSVVEGQIERADHPRQGGAFRGQDQGTAGAIRDFGLRLGTDHRRRWSWTAISRWRRATYPISTCCRSRGSMFTTFFAGASWC